MSELDNNCNPITQIRGRLTRLEFAQVLSLTYWVICDAEAGRITQFSPRLRRALDSNGFDSEQLEQEYLVWREAKKKLLASLPPVRRIGNERVVHE